MLFSSPLYTKASLQIEVRPDTDQTLHIRMNQATMDTNIVIEASGHALNNLPSVAASSRTLRQEPSSEFKPSQDEAILAYFGKRQQLKVSSPIVVLFTASTDTPSSLKRNLGLLSIVGLTCTILITWEGLLTLVNNVQTK